MPKRYPIFVLAGLAPLIVMAALGWRINDYMLTGMAMTAARSAIAETERYFDKIAVPLSGLSAVADAPCTASVIESLDQASIAALVVHDVLLYDQRQHLYCSGRGPRNLDLTRVEDRRIMPTGVDVVMADATLSPKPAILVDLAWPNGGGVAALTDLALFAEMAPPFALGEEGALAVRLADGTPLRQSGQERGEDESPGMRTVSISSRYGVTAEVELPNRLRNREFFKHLALFEAVGATVSALLLWLLSTSLSSRHSITRGLKAAMKDGQLEVHYQPVIDLRAGCCVGAEALMRWRHPEHGLIRPDLFIPIAEETGLIVPLTRWAMARIRDDFERCALPEDFHIAINLAPQNLERDEILTDAKTIFTGRTLSPKNIIFEVTERYPIGAEGGKIIQALRALGHGVAVDDFGTGHSGLAYLQKYPFNYLKIDQSFVNSIGTDAVNLTVVDAIIDLSHDLGIGIIAEGIEKDAHLHYLGDRGVQLGQGWLFAKALPIREFLNFLQEFRVPLSKAAL